MANFKSDSSAVTSVGCDVKNCKFHDAAGGWCTAAHITVENKAALSKGETYCGTFLPKGSF